MVTIVQSIIGFIRDHKKLSSSILASILALIAFILEMEVAQVAIIIGPLTGFTVSQGLADFGKERAKIEFLNRVKE